jgi:selT/selW/selH-like putative selenoprotein
VTLIPGDKGAFEITVNGQKVYSKWETKKFPELNELKESIQTFVK